MKKLIYLLVLQMFVLTGMAFAVGDPKDGDNFSKDSPATANVEGMECKECRNSTLGETPRYGAGKGNVDTLVGPAVKGSVQPPPIEEVPAQ